MYVLFIHKNKVKKKYIYEKISHRNIRKKAASNLLANSEKLCYESSLSDRSVILQLLKLHSFSFNFFLELSYFIS